ncbi:MAG: nuclear transport factor 2 family protein [Rhizomicrobium sp.]|nr:nuclear transport factor 2 family protein [Rhizomicrobium sp.]
MKSVIAACAVACLVSGAAMAGAAEDKLIALENSWAAAFVKKDATTISGFLADDWVGQSEGPKPESKAGLLGDVKSGKLAFTSLKLRDMKVRILGNVAIVQGYDDEKSSYDKKDSSGSYSWIDVFENRGGKWLAVAGQVTKVQK